MLHLTVFYSILNISYKDRAYCNKYALSHIYTIHLYSIRGNDESVSQHWPILVQTEAIFFTSYFLLVVSYLLLVTFY